MDAGVLADPDVAVSVAVPFPTDITKPADVTVATAASEDVHVTVAPDTAFPFASLIVVVNGLQPGTSSELSAS